MPDFDYSEAQATAFELIGGFGADALVLDISTDYDPVSGQTSEGAYSLTPVKAVSLPIASGLGLNGDKQFQTDLKAGRIKGFYATSGESEFEAEPGFLLVWDEKVWDVVSVSGLAPAGVPVMFALGCKESSKYDWPTLKDALEIANDFFSP